MKQTNEFCYAEVSRKTQIIVAIVFQLITGLVAASDLGVDRRSQVSPARASRMELLASKMFPGCTLDWNHEQVVRSDGSRIGFSLGIYEEQVNRNDKSIFIIASRAPDESENRSVERKMAFQQVGEGMPHCKLHLLLIDTSGMASVYKETGLDVPDIPSTCYRVGFDYAYESAGVLSPQLRGEPDPLFPWVVVNFTTLHFQADAWATVTWAGVLDTNTMKWVSRLPVWFHGKRRDRKEAAFAIRNDRGESGGGQWLFFGLNGHGDEPKWKVRVPCKVGSCKVDPKAIIDSAFESSAWD